MNETLETEETMKFKKRFKDKENSFELNEKQIRFDLEPHYRDIDIIIEALIKGDHNEINPIQTRTAYYWCQF